MSRKDKIGLWITKAEGGEWHGIEWDDAEYILHEKSTPRPAAFGIRIDGKDMVYDFVLGRWRVPSDLEKQVLPDLVWSPESYSTE